MKKLIIVVVMMLSLLSTCYANITQELQGRDDFSDESWKELRWTLDTSIELPKKIDPYVGLFKSYNEKTGKVRYWITFNYLQNQYCFFPLSGDHKVRVGDEVYSIPITESKVNRIVGEYYTTYTESSISLDLISKIKKSDSVTFRFIYSVYHPSKGNNETITIPIDVLNEWGKIID